MSRVVDMHGVVRRLESLLEQARRGTLRGLAVAWVDETAEPHITWLGKPGPTMHVLSSAVADLHFRVFHDRFDMCELAETPDDDTTA